MQKVLSAYHCVILDFSAMFAELDSSLVRELNQATNLYVASTFHCECEQMQKVVSYRIAAHYKNNQQRILINASKLHKTIGTTDTFTLADRLSRRYDSVLVVEANYSLEDRIVLSGTSVDVYNLFEKKLIGHNHYRREARNRTIDKSKTPLVYYEVKSGDSVYAESGQYVLADSLEGGAEAQIFKVSNDPKILAKIYKKDEDDNFVLTKQKWNNIQILREIHDNWDVPWLALPVDVVYADPSHTNPIGYIMKYFDETRFLSNNSLFSGGDINAKFPEHDKTTIKDVLEICIKFVGQILFLTLNDIHISDYNDKNFAIPIKSDSKIVMIDTDSYCCEEYVSECMTYSGCLSKNHDCNTRLDLINFCDESLYAFIFTRLMLDSTFVPMRKSEFRFSEQRLEKLDNPNLRAKWNSVPKNLQNLFVNIFDKKCPASIDVLLYELETAYRQEFANTRYKDIYKEVLEGIQAPPQPQPVRLYPPSRKRHRAWRFALGVLVIGILAALAVWGIWRFGYGLSGVPANESDPAEQSDDTMPIKRSLRQIKRFETQDGYYMSYTPELDGYIEFYWDNNESYKGNFSDGVMTGYGEYEWPDGGTYAGDFVDGEMTGEGTRCYSDDTKYIGAFLNGVPNGQGTLYDADGNIVYEGSFSDGVMMGYGEYKYPDGGTYAGDFVDGEMTGEGTRCYSDGTKYIGAFVNGVPNGQGTFYVTNGDILYEGGWEEGFFSGEGIFYFPNGASYKNTWKNGTCNEGQLVNLVYTHNHERAAKGYWEANVFYGFYCEDGEWYEIP